MIALVSCTPIILKEDDACFASYLLENFFSAELLNFERKM